MLNIKPQIWTKNGREQFVMLSMRDFEKVQELIEDAGRSRILRAARRRNANSPTISSTEMQRRLGLRPSTRRRTAKSR